MGTAPYSRIERAPLSDSDNTLEVLEDEGAKFTAPFHALIWKVQMAPRARGIDSTEIIVSAVAGDTLTFTRTDSFEITAGLMIAVLSREDILAMGDVVRLLGTFPGGSGTLAGTLHLQSPQGELTDIGGTALTIASPGNYYYDFTPTENGGWKAQWESSTGTRNDEVSFFVNMDSI